MDKNEKDHKIHIFMGFTFLLATITAVLLTRLPAGQAREIKEIIFFITTPLTFVITMLLTAHLLQAPLAKFFLKKEPSINKKLVIAYTLTLAVFFWMMFLFQPEGGHPPGNFTRCQGNLKHIGTALEMYSTDFQGKYPDSLSRLTPEYLVTIPTCPGAERDTYSESYTRRSDWETYIFYCRGKNHGEVGVEEDYPHYDSINGLICNKELMKKEKSTEGSPARGDNN